MKRQTIVFKDKKLSYQIAGTGTPTILLLHGFPEDGTIFDSQIAFLQSYFTVIIPDLPGSGQSEFNESLQNVEDFAECIYAIAAHEQIYGLNIFGHSMGGYITLAFVSKYPERVHSFGLIHSSALPDTPEKIENRKKSIHIMAQYGADAFVAKTIPNLFAPSFKLKQENIIAALVQKANYFQTPALQLYYEIMLQRPDRKAVLKTNKPVLFVIGQEDPTMAIADIAPQLCLPDTCAFHILPHVGHMSMVENPAALNTILYKFIQSFSQE